MTPITPISQTDLSVRAKTALSVAGIKTVAEAKAWYDSYKGMPHHRVPNWGRKTTDELVQVLNAVEFPTQAELTNDLRALLTETAEAQKQILAKLTAIECWLERMNT